MQTMPIQPGIRAVTYPIQDALTSYEWFRAMRNDQPVFFDDQLGVWHVTRYTDCLRVVNDHAVYSNHQRPGTIFYGSFLDKTLVTADPPDHRKLRNLVAHLFTPQAIGRWEARVTAIVQGLLDRAHQAGQLDIVSDLAFPLPAMVMADFMGIADDWDIFGRWAQGRTLEQFPEDDPRAFASTLSQEQHSFFAELLDERRRKPGTDIISLMGSAKLDNEHLTNEEIINFCMLLLAAGQETTKNLIANAIWCLTQNPASLALLRTDQTLIGSTIEETLRYLSPVWSLFRLTNEKVEIAGQPIEADQQILTWLSSANRDERQFEAADTFDIRRKVNPHVAFGNGIHYCLGAPLARFETQIALRMLLNQFSTIQPASEKVEATLGFVFVIKAYDVRLSA